MLDLRWEPNEGRIRLQIQPAGEDRPITVTITDFELSTDGTLTIKALEVDRTWMHLLAGRLAVGRQIPLGADAMHWLELLGIRPQGGHG